MLPTGTAPSPAGDYLDWGVIHISVTNLTIILVMLAVFVLAVLLPFPGTRSTPSEEGPAPGRRTDG
jgi:hypothetical protein